MLWGAFGNASQGMMSMDSAMGTISQNIANVNTTGYKAKDTEFKTLLSGSHAAPTSTNNSPTTATATTGLNIFAVQAVDRNFITKQGTISATGNWTDVAINGRGLFLVSQPDTSGSPQTGLTTTSSSMLYTRAGDFGQKAVNGNSYFVTSSGQYLMGWQADAQGNIPGVVTTSHSPVSTTTSTTPASSASAALVPVYANIGQTIPGVATTAIQAVMNLPSNATATASPQSFTNTTAITDGTGAQQDLTMSWTRLTGDTWQVDFALPASPASGSVGTITGSPVTVTMDQSGTITSPALSASGVGFQDLVVNWSAGATTQTSASIDLNSQKPTLQTIPLTLTAFDNTYKSENLPVSFERDGSGQWNMRVNLPSSEGVVSGLKESGGSASLTAGTYSAPIQFDGSGKIQGPDTISFQVAWDPTTHPGGGTNTITVDVSKLTQYTGSTASTIDVKSLDQDGYASGALTSASFNDKGELIGSFSNGHSRTLFMLPVATFTATDQLTPISGTLFANNDRTGAMSVDSIAAQGSGAAMSGGSVETSNVKLEDEFTRMIVTQKAYSMNAQVFKTADEMTTSARDLLR